MKIEVEYLALIVGQLRVIWQHSSTNRPSIVRRMTLTLRHLANAEMARDAADTGDRLPGPLDRVLRLELLFV